MGRGTISDDSIPWHLAGGCPAGSKTSTVDAPSSLVGFGGGPPLDDLDVVAVGIGHGADQAECLLLDLANPAHAEAIEVRLAVAAVVYVEVDDRSEEQTSELQSIMRISYAVFGLKKNKHQHTLSYRIDNSRH